MGKITKQAQLGKVSPATSAARAELLRKAQANRSKASCAVTAKASAPITAADVWEFRNPEDTQASNALVGGTIADTLENCRCVLAFLSDFHARKPSSQMNAAAQDGLCTVVVWVQDAIEKQASELVVLHG